MIPPLKSNLAAILVFLIVSALCFVAVELGYRQFLIKQMATETTQHPPPPEDATIAFYSKPWPWRFELVGGFAFNLGKWYAANLEKKSFKNCIAIGEGNEFGGYGRVVVPWESADLKVLLLGSSYTLRGQIGADTGELVRQKLAALTGLRVSVINRSLDSTGILTAFDVAADSVERLQPDVIALTFNTSAFGYRRHWRTVTSIGNGLYILNMSLDPRDTIDPNRSFVSANIVVESMTEQWCDTMLAAKERGDLERMRHDPIINKAIEGYELYRKIQAEPKRSKEFGRWDVSFVYNMIRYKDPYHNLNVKEDYAVFNPLTIHDFREDRGFNEAQTKLSASGVPLLLLHIPAMPEFSGEPNYAFSKFGVVQAVGDDLVKSLESASKTKIQHLLDYYPKDERLNWTNLIESDKDWHPNAHGNDVLAKAIANAIKQAGLHSKAPVHMDISMSK